MMESIKIVDLKNYLTGEVFEKLKDTYYFQNFKNLTEYY